MNSKNVLIVSRFFYPDIRPRSSRAFELAKEFARQGHKVVVLTTKKDINYSSLEKKYGFCVKDIVKSEPKEIQGEGIKRVLRFSLAYLFLYPSILLTRYFKKALIKEKRYDLLISIAHPYSVHFGVVLALKNNKTLTKTWIADCGDPFTGIQHALLPYPFYYKIIERWFCKKADFITVPIQEAISAYPQNYIHKIRVIPQGFNLNDVSPSYIEGKNEVPTFAYAGTLSPRLRDPRALLEFLTRNDLKFRFIIYTRNKAFLSEYVKKLGHKLELRDYVPRDTLLKELGQMDFLLNLENKGDVQRPSKLIDYALLKRPILSLSPSNINTTLVIDFLNGNYSKSLMINNIEDYNIKNVVESFMQCTFDMVEE
ncbi:glycosyltransferase [Winogradskyella sp. A2]|uniref:glycosyltransferase n=1 Tax=Winogradskyella sp. A2 TaxID=3366944 RepID=UPI00398C2FB5